MKKELIIFITLLTVINIFCWDRYSNDSEMWFQESINFQSIIHYSFYVSTSQTVTLETTNTSGDTYMYLWSETDCKQIAKDDDSGEGACSKIITSLSPGTYIVFIRSYSSNAASTCNLLKNGQTVLTNAKYSGYKYNVSQFNEETRFKAQPDYGDTYCLLVNTNGDLIGYNDDSNSSLGSQIIASEKPLYFILGSYSPTIEGTARFSFTEDMNKEYLAM
ncbi:MAG TPA: PPC domain-containing protein, partial [Spirochaetota bacterium]|nr:PPC domain-containing protein [Spirochaetota bacterium]